MMIWIVSRWTNCIKLLRNIARIFVRASDCIYRSTTTRTQLAWRWKTLSHYCKRERYSSWAQQWKVYIYVKWNINLCHIKFHSWDYAPSNCHAQHSVKEEVGRRKWMRVRCGRGREKKREWMGEGRHKGPKTMLNAKPNLTIVCAIVCYMFVRC